MIEDTRLRVSIAFTGLAPIGPTVEVAKAAERYGFDGVWAAEHLGFHDAVVPATMYLQATHSLEVGLVGLSTAGRHPGMMAMELASLCELAPGRVRVQVGTGDLTLIPKFGATVRRPIEATAALVTALRGTLAGHEMNETNNEFSFFNFSIPAPRQPPPIDVMAIRPRMLRLAAQVGDGVSLSGGASPTYLASTVANLETELARAGRVRSSFRVTAATPTMISNDLADAQARMAKMFTICDLGLLLHLAGDVLAHAYPEHPSTYYGQHAPLEVFTAPVLEALSLVSTPADLPQALARRARTGVDELALVVLASAEQQLGVIEWVADARSRMQDNPVVEGPPPAPPRASESQQ